MLNIQKSKNTILISNISIITFLNFAFYTRAASLLASRGLEARGHTYKAETHEAEAMTHEVEAKTHEAEASRLNITDVFYFNLCSAKQLPSY